MNFRIFFAADRYNQDAYGSGAYQEVLGSETGTSPTAGGPLANTGYDIIIPAALGVAVVIASGVLLVRRLRSKKS